MSKRAIDRENNMVVEASADTPRKRYYCLGESCQAEMHLVIREDVAHFSAYADKPHDEYCPFRQYGKWARSVIPEGFNIVGFFNEVLRNQVTMRRPFKHSISTFLPKPTEEEENISFVRNLSSLTKFCLSHSLDTPIDPNFTVGSLCIASGNVDRSVVTPQCLRLLIGTVQRIDKSKNFLVLNIKERTNINIYIKISTELTSPLIDKVKRKYPDFLTPGHTKFPASILCVCRPENRTTVYFKNYVFHTTVSSYLFNLNYICVL